LGSEPEAPLPLEPPVVSGGWPAEPADGPDAAGSSLAQAASSANVTADTIPRRDLRGKRPRKVIAADRVEPSLLIVVRMFFSSLAGASCPLD